MDKKAQTELGQKLIVASMKQAALVSALQQNNTSLIGIQKQMEKQRYNSMVKATDLYLSNMLKNINPEFVASIEHWSGSLLNVLDYIVVSDDIDELDGRILKLAEMVTETKEV